MGRLLAAVSAMLPTRNRSWKIAVPPKMVNQAKLNSVGARITPNTNWRTVTPREMRAMKAPTNGPHETHHAK